MPTISSTHLLGKQIILELPVKVIIKLQWNTLNICLQKYELAIMTHLLQVQLAENLLNRQLSYNVLWEKYKTEKILSINFIFY